MASRIIIKSIPNGLKIHLPDDVPFSEVRDELINKIRDSKGFFKGSKIAVSFEGRELDFDEEKALIASLELAGDMNVLYSIGKSTEMDASVARVINRSLNNDALDTFGKLYTGSLKKGERLETETGIVLLGDVEPGATLVSRGSVVVLGGIYGSVICEASDDETRLFIAANNISAENIKIGKYRYFTTEKPKWLIKPKMQSKICFCENEQVVVKPVDEISLRKLCDTISAGN